MLNLFQHPSGNTSAPDGAARDSRLRGNDKTKNRAQVALSAVRFCLITLRAGRASHEPAKLREAIASRRSREAT
jgi:hypothetical protein